MASDDTKEMDNAESEGGEKKGKRLIIIILGLVLLIGGAGAAAYFGGFIGGKKDEAPAEEKVEKKEKSTKNPEQAKQGDPVYFQLPEFLNNLNTGGTQTSFIKVSVILEVASADDVKRVEQMQPRIIDDFNTYLRELRASDMAGSAGLERLREELMRRVNKAIAPAKVNNVLFKEIIVQ
ncbi:MAG: flagellar basal body-associated FliL family protein [Rickettsiales bacterium]|nr:flagellar basal body-associated FliL family protein [Rickettsiales bacterium]